MKRLLFDVNVVLECCWIASRLRSLVRRVVGGRARRGRRRLSAHAVTTLHYLNAKSVGSRVATETTEALLSVFEVAPVDEAVMRSAVSLKWQDFEDAVTAAGARRAKCDAVVTRNPRDFKGAALRILTPSEAVAWIETSA